MVYVVILAILTGMLIGFQRGFLRSVFKLLITILSVVLSYVLAPLIANWVISYTTLDDNLQKSIATQIEKSARQQITSQLEATVGQYGVTVTDDMVNAALDTQLSENQQADMLYRISMPENARETILQNAATDAANYAARSFYQYVAGCACAGRRICGYIFNCKHSFIYNISVAVICTSDGVTWRYEPGDGGFVWRSTDVGIYMDGFYCSALCNWNFCGRLLNGADTE